MRDELEMKLAEEFSFMQKGLTLAQQRANGPINDLYSAFGCECRDGWYELLRSLCTEIDEAYAEAGLPVDIRIDQIKEKFGTLRFYYHTWEHADKTPENEAAYKEVHLKIGEIVGRYEEISEEVCEECGKPGVLRNDLRWIQTLCDDCCAAVKERMENQHKNTKKKMEALIAQLRTQAEERTGSEMEE